jgi:hypothetical protein
MIIIFLEEKKILKMEKNSVDGLILLDGLMMVMMMILLLFKFLRMEFLKRDLKTLHFFNMLNLRDQLK